MRHQQPAQGEDGQEAVGSQTSLEDKHVTCVYNHIAKHFSDTRHTPWPRVKEFLQSLDAGSLVYDIGCGNGKYSKVNPLIHMIGVDSSVELLKISQGTGMSDVLLSDAKTLPLRSGTADNVISIAVLHHLSSPASRLKALAEMVRVLKAGGSSLITVWAFEQNRNGSASKYITKSSSSASKADTSNVICMPSSSSHPPTDHMLHVQKAKPTLAGDDPVITALPVHRNRTPFESQDVLVPWKCKETNQTLLRYYHVFVEHELTHLCERIPGIAVIDHFYDEGNWCIVIQKNGQRRK